MRLSIFMLVCMFTLPVIAAPFPDFADPVLKGFAEKYTRDYALLKNPDFLKAPTPAMEWPCAVDEKELYKLAGLQGAHPELKIEFDKNMRKAFRSTDMGISVPKDTYSNIQFSPIKASCVEGKLEGEVQFLAVFDKESVTTTNRVVDASTVAHNTMTMNQHSIIRNHAFYKGGLVDVSAESIAFSTMIMSNQTHSDHPPTEESLKMMNKMGANIASSFITYVDGGGTHYSFIDVNNMLMTMVRAPLGNDLTRMTQYMNKNLIGTQTLKNGVNHGEQIIYQDNYLKAINKRLEDMPGMEDSKIEMVDGVEKIVKRICWNAGQQVKIVPCVVE